MVKQEWSLDELKYKAEAYCSIAEHCDSEVTNKLLQWGAQNGQIEENIYGGGYQGDIKNSDIRVENRVTGRQSKL